MWVFWKKKKPRGKKPTTAWGKTPMSVGVLTHGLSGIIVPKTGDYGGSEYFKQVYRSDMEM